MKTTQAWGWLAAGVLALGLNGFYQDGGFAWAHRVADRAVEASGAVKALALGRADEFLAEAQILPGRSEDPSDAAASAMARAHENLDEQLMEAGIQQQVDEQVFENAEAKIQARVAACQVRAARMQAMADRRQARLDAEQARMNARLAARTVRINLARAAFNSSNFAPGSRVCVRVSGRIPPTPVFQIPELRVPAAPAAPEIHIEAPSAGPV